MVSSGSGFRVMKTFSLFTAIISLVAHLGATYKQGEKVILYVNKVGPFFNPHETYHYYQLPVCRPDKIEHKSLTLSEVLAGDRMAVSNYEIIFKENVSQKHLCTVRIDQNDLTKLLDAIEDLYYFEFVLDDIPLRGFVGHLEEGGFLPHTHKMFLWTHLTFNIDYNKDKIVGATVSTRDRSPLNLNNLDVPATIKHTYSVHWYETSDTYEDRMKKIHNSSFFPKTLEIHWISIINSVILVGLLIGFVIIILTRILRNDFARYNMDDDELAGIDGDEYGWKIICSDVFRFPRYKGLFCAILGVGIQFLTIAFGIIVMAMMNMFNVHHHRTMNSTACFLYAFTSCIAGYVSSCMYQKMGGQHWVQNINLTSCLFSLPFFVIWSIQNTIAWSYASTQALPVTTILLLLCIWVFVGYPLAILGGILGKNCKREFSLPCKAKSFTHPIPRVPWYQNILVHCAIGGFLPFSAVSVELYYIFATLWGREQYTLYGILLLVFFILLSVTACISVALTYFQLSSEDYRWWWRSIFSAGSTCFFVFIYAVFYYFRRSNMSGTLQAVQFFGDTLLTCYVFFLSLGTVSFFASFRFVLYIYRNIKID